MMPKKANHFLSLVRTQVIPDEPSATTAPQSDCSLPWQPPEHEACADPEQMRGRKFKRGGVNGLQKHLISRAIDPAADAQRRRHDCDYLLPGVLPHERVSRDHGKGREHGQCYQRFEKRCRALKHAVKKSTLQCGEHKEKNEHEEDDLSRAPGADGDGGTGGAKRIGYSWRSAHAKWADRCPLESGWP